MPRLIDADALKEKISYRQWDVDDDLPRDEASTRISECYVIDHMVDDMPTVDAVPVRHGKWIDITESHIGTCSLCGDRWGSVDMMNYCPSCGARMDAERKEE